MLYCYLTCISNANSFCFCKFWNIRLCKYFNMEYFIFNKNVTFHISILILIDLKYWPLTVSIAVDLKIFRKYLHVAPALRHHKFRKIFVLTLFLHLSIFLPFSIRSHKLIFTVYFYVISKWQILKVKYAISRPLQDFFQNADKLLDTIISLWYDAF